jgi:hypothetical protein
MIQEDTLTDIISTAPTSIHRSSLPRPGLPKISVGAALGTIVGLVGNAFNLAYVDPYSGVQRKPPIIPDDDLEDRDPNW